VRSRQGGLLLVPAAAVVVHQARYSLAYGPRASSELVAQGHSYLHSVVPWTILALGLAATSFVRRVAAAYRTGNAGLAPLGTARVWAAAFGALLAIYAVQETLEGFVVSGHPSGVAGVVGHGGWWAIPAAALVAGAVTAVLLLGRALLRIAAAARSRLRRSFDRVLLPAGIVAAVVRPLARAAAGRAPPLAPATR
jgi:hypothetical protein